MFSRIIYFLCVALMCYASFCFFPRWKQPGTQAAIAWDVSGYYLYLPSIFIYKDLKQQTFKPDIQKKYGPTGDIFEQGFRAENGNWVIKYPSGMAVMYSPFFAVAHLLAKPLGYPPDGFSAPYQFAIQLGGFLIALLGLWYLRKLLLLFYNDTVTGLILIILVAGSNFLNYGAIDTGMSHCWLFTIYVFLLLNTHYFYKDPKLKYALRIGALVGLATLARPTEVISCLIPLLWGMESISVIAFKERFAFIGKHLKQMIPAAVCAACIISIQLIYWKYVSGHWIVYSYQDEGFSWLRPHLHDYPFSFRTGWLIYTPMLIFSFIGIIPFVRFGKNKVAILTFFLLNFYIVCAWDIWWFGGRAMIQSYPILMFPMAALVDVMLKKKIWLWVLTPVFLLFIYLSLWFTCIEHFTNVYDSECMTQAYYFKVAGRYSVAEEYIKLRDTDELFTGEPKNKKLVYQNDFEQDTSIHCSLPPIDGRKSFCLDDHYEYSPKYSFPYSPGRAQWLRVDATYKGPKEWGIWNMQQVIVQYYNKTEKIKEKSLRIPRFIDNNVAKDIYIDVKIPKEPFDSVSVFFARNNSKLTLQVDDLKVWSFDE